MAKNDKNNTKNANEGIRYGPRTGGDYRRSHDAFTGYNDCFYRDRFSDGSISGQRSRGTVGFHCLSAGSCCGDTCCGMGRRMFWRTALLLLPQGAGALLTRTAAGRLTDAYGGRGRCDRTDSLSGGNGERGRLHHVLPGAGGRFGGGRCRFPDISPVKMNQKTSSPHRPLCGIMSAERSLYHRAYRFLRPPQKAGRIRRRQHVCEADML